MGEEIEGGHLEGEEIEGGHSGEVRRLKGVILEGEEIEGGHPGQVRRFMGVILEGEEIESQRPPARKGSVFAPQGRRRRAAERLELLVTLKMTIHVHIISLAGTSLWPKRRTGQWN